MRLGLLSSILLNHDQAVECWNASSPASYVGLTDDRVYDEWNYVNDPGGPSRRCYEPTVWS